MIAELSRLPGLGEKSAQRLAFHILKTKNDSARALSQALLDVKDQVHHCPQCFNYTDQNLCAICRDLSTSVSGTSSRQRDLLCVVEDAADILRIESAMHFKGGYHVLQGVLSPLDGIGPDQIRFQELLKRLEEGGMKEIILALDADLEGDATSMYITKIVKQSFPEIRVTRIAHGVPIGGNLEYVDYRTLSRALEDRVEL